MDTVTEIKDGITPSTHLILATTTANITAINNNNNNNNDSINNNNSINIDTQLLQIQQQQQQQQQQHQLQHQQFHPLYVTSQDNNETDNFLTTTGTAITTVATTATTTTNFVAIPLSERQPIICISQNGNNNNNNHQTHQHSSHHQHHENYSNTSLTRSKSCLVRWRQCCLNFFTKIMGSNNPSEADRYEYYDCELKS